MSFNDCGDHVQFEEQTIYVRDAWRFDEHGNPVSLHWQLTGEIRLYAEGHSQDYPSGQRREHQFATWEDGAFDGFTVAGLNYRVHVPGMGIGRVLAGLLAFDADFHLVITRGARKSNWTDEQWCEATRP